MCQKEEQDDASCSPTSAPNDNGYLHQQKCNNTAAEGFLMTVLIGDPMVFTSARI